MTHLSLLVAHAEVTKSELFRNFGIDSDFIYTKLDGFFGFVLLFLDLLSNIVRQSLKIEFRLLISLLLIRVSWELSFLRAHRQTLKQPTLQKLSSSQSTRSR